MTGTESGSSWKERLDALNARSLELEQDMARLLKSPDGNSNYRNDIIWLAEEITRLQQQVKELESRGSRGGIQKSGGA